MIACVLCFVSGFFLGTLVACLLMVGAACDKTDRRHWSGE